jgi:hypothetical protein
MLDRRIRIDHRFESFHHDPAVNYKGYEQHRSYARA